MARYQLIIISIIIIEHCVQFPHVNLWVLIRHIGISGKSSHKAMTSSCTEFIWLLDISNRIFLPGAVREIWHVKWSGVDLAPLTKLVQKKSLTLGGLILN